MKKINIAIDGPAGAGKSTVAKEVAKRLGYIYIDTGAMYRALTFQALELGIEIDDENELNNYLRTHTIQLLNENSIQTVMIDGKDITKEIRSREVTQNVSLVSSYPLVRETMVKMQRKLAKGNNVVMDGRDIGTNVLPDAEIKIFLTASIDERAKRRYKELVDAGVEADLGQIMADIELRDKKDQERTINPLKKADDAILLDTSKYNIEEVVNKILFFVNEKLKGE